MLRRRSQKPTSEEIADAERSARIRQRLAALPGPPGRTQAPPHQAAEGARMTGRRKPVTTPAAMAEEERTGRRVARATGC